MHITMVIVLYKQSIKQCKTYQTLIKSLENTQIDLTNTHVIFYDNSPESQVFKIETSLDLNTSYIHDKRNLGIANAYNYAFQKANENGSKWLLLFDHDTELTQDYFEKCQHLVSIDANVAAVVPKINSENQMISPVFSNTLRPLVGEKPNSGLQDFPVMAINSGAMIRVSFLNEIGGFSNQFPLDYLDHWLFHEVYDKGYKVWTLDTYLEHELSVMDYSRVSFQRYKSILDSEIRFYKNYKKDLFSSYRIQLAKRFLKQILLVKNKKIAAYTLRRFLSL